MMSLDKWDFRFLELANIIASWSKDPGTKVGAIMVKDKRIISTGYNGFPSKLSDSLERYLDRNIKLNYTVHAEVNAILNAAKNGSKTEGSTLYTTFFPCVNCATSTIQAGVVKLVTPNIESSPQRWMENFRMSKSLLTEANIIVLEY